MSTKDAKEMITGTQLAKELNVTGSRVSQVISKLNLKDHLIKQGNKKLIAKEDAELIRKYFISASEERASYNHTDNQQGLESVVKELSSQIKELNKQLSVKDEQISKQQQLADQAQRLQSDIQQQFKDYKLLIETSSAKEDTTQDLEALKKQLEEERNDRIKLQDELNQERNKSFWGKIFGA
ncbi:hypothetical protein ACF0HZ_10960 (plasmid) [Leuconostoc suionicum]|uniref:hypothetical protein n=1 Tax=Leuconostoc suionicum TaxID=1511761 RepID=UPI0037485AB1